MQAVLDTVTAVLASRDRELEDYAGFDYPHHWADLTPLLIDPGHRDDAVALLQENDKAAEDALGGYEYPTAWADIVPILFSDRWETAVALLEYRDRSLESFTAGVDA